MPSVATPRKPAAKRFSQAEALQLWRRYRATNDPRLRDRLILTHAPLVKHIVYRKIRELPSHQEADDYVSRGLEALITSIDRYDPARGPRSSSSHGPASTAPCSTSCAPIAPT